VLLKLLALVLGIACWRTARLRLLDRVVLFYSVLVAYNLTCLLLGLIAQARP
jgi:hypothetical protein